MIMLSVVGAEQKLQLETGGETGMTHISKLEGDLSLEMPGLKP